jgi:murein DD-endopeptidase MepM/ murein hydrolase activator NlpD
MPQHWVGRIAVAVAFALAAATVQPTSSDAAATAPAIGSFGALSVVPRVSFDVEGSQMLSALSLAAASDSAALGLPWTQGNAWRLTGGPHNHTGKSAHPWSSLDFAAPVSGTSAKVRAARDGVVLRPCRNLVQIRHDDGWATAYYHLKNITVKAGQRVGRGALIGYTSAQSGCGGSASGSHVHFALLRYGSHVNLDGMSIGGWSVNEGKGQYYGCLARADKRKCAPTGRVENTGAIGTQ